MYTDDALISTADKINLLCGQYQELTCLSAPRVVVMGIQSSGKSSVVNRLIGFDALPTGRGIVTRTPIYVKLLHDEMTHPKLMLYLPNGDTREHVFEIILDNDEQRKLEQFRSKLMELTAIVAGNNKNISETPICLDIYWDKFKTNFSFVDLPGRVLISTSDQPATLKQDIDNLIKKQLLIKNTIALVIIQSKTDLVTDSGLELFKEIEKSTGQQIKSIGVLTKPDTMSKDDVHILNDFAMGRINKAVSLSDGYFVVHNTIENEQNYFVTTFGKSSDIIQNERYGLRNLHQHLKSYLIKSIKSCLPQVKQDMCELLKQKQYEYQCLGGDTFEHQNKQYFVNKIITELCGRLTNSIDSKLVKDNVGYVIGESIRNMIHTMKKLTPFDNNLETTKYFQELVRYSRGYKLTSQASLEEMIDNCLKEPKYSPTNVLIISVRKCVTEIEVALTMAVNNLINSGSIELIQLYPQFKDYIFEIAREKLHEFCDKTIKEIQKYLEKQKTVVWSTDSEFSSLLSSYYYSDKTSTNTVAKTMGIGCAMNALLKPSKQRDEIRNNFEFSAEQVKIISSSYYKTIINRSKDMISQDIIYGIVLKVKNDIAGLLLVSVLQRNLDELLVEDKSEMLKRSAIKHSITILNQTLVELSMF